MSSRTFNACPKCHGGQLSGPFYRPADAPGGLDWLLYRCACCGYEEKREPKDRAVLSGAEVAQRYLGERR